MTPAAIDLSARPFVNRRPVVRLSMLLWLAGALFLAGNVWLYWDFIAGRGNLHAQLRETNEAIAVEQRRISALSEELASFDLQGQNTQVTYLNQRIAQRRFSWSRLFDELSGLLPRDVRLTSLAPSADSEESGGRRRSSRTASIGSDRVLLAIEAQARDDQAILDFVDALFSDPSFDRPNLEQQRTERSGVVSFTLTVVYTPDRSLEADVLEVRDGTEPAATEEDGAAARAVVPRLRPESSAAPRPASPDRRDDGSPARLGRPASSPPEIS